MLVRDIPSGKVIRVLKVSSERRWSRYRSSYAAKGNIGVLLRVRGGSEQLLLRNGKTKYIMQGDAEAAFIKKPTIRAGIANLGDTRASISIGADPEVFVLVNNTVLPAFKFLPAKHTTVEPQLFWDGFQAEFTLAPTTCINSHVWNVGKSLIEILAAAKKADDRAKLSAACVVDVPERLMAECTDEQVALGCSPSLNIYSGVSPLSVEGRNLSIRFAGYHMHFGIKELHNPEPLQRTVKLIDAIYGIASVSLLEGLEDERRRQFYGRAGEYRLPEHGLEYRVPSSAMLSNPTLVHFSLDLARFALLAGLNNVNIKWDAGGDERVQYVINTLDVREARRILSDNDTVLKEILHRLYEPVQAEAAHRLLLVGAKNYLDTYNIEKVWRDPHLRVADLGLAK